MKLLVIVGSIFITLLGMSSCYVFKGISDDISNIKSVQEERLKISGKQVLWGYSYNTLSILSGDSMIQYGFKDGQLISIYPYRKCRVGNYCGFTCLAKKCIHNDHNQYLKKLVKLEGDCYWFEGNPKPIIEGDIIKTSWDSRTYGCLKTGEFKVVGVI
jgi:hypothetical protein